MQIKTASFILVITKLKFIKIKTNKPNKKSSFSFSTNKRKLNHHSKPIWIIPKEEFGKRLKPKNIEQPLA